MSPEGNVSPVRLIVDRVFSAITSRASSVLLPPLPNKAIHIVLDDQVLLQVLPMLQETTSMVASCGDLVHAKLSNSAMIRPSGSSARCTNAPPRALHQLHERNPFSQLMCSEIATTVKHRLSIILKASVACSGYLLHDSLEFPIDIPADADFLLLQSEGVSSWVAGDGCCVAVPNTGHPGDPERNLCRGKSRLGLGELLYVPARQTIRLSCESAPCGILAFSIPWLAYSDVLEHLLLSDKALWRYARIPEAPQVPDFCSFLSRIIAIGETELETAVRISRPSEARER
jgi:hypothetical protein